jgi:hypothetical protein
MRQLFKAARSTLERYLHQSVLCRRNRPFGEVPASIGVYAASSLSGWVSSDQQQANLISLNRDTSRHAISPYGENQIHTDFVRSPHRIEGPAR